MAPADVPSMVYVMGRGYSGSTIVSSLLGHIHGVQCVGELIYPMDILCGCGETFAECAFWTQVAERFERNTQEDWHESLRKIRDQAHFKRFFKTAFARREGPYLSELIDIDESIRSAILAAAGATTVLDSSKQPSRAMLLMRGDPDARFIHIVRSPDSYLHSYIRRSQRGHFNFMRRQLGGDSANFFMFMLVALGWLVVNLQCEIVRLFRRRRVLRVRYEDLVDSPREEIVRIGTFLGIDDRELENLLEAMERKARIPVGHIIAGNAHMREAGGFVFEPRISKPAQLTFFYSLMVRAISWPLMILYRYPMAFRKAAADSMDSKPTPAM